jgi:threonine dehydrogenase-like Zn-dependent dehydrogenase
VIDAAGPSAVLAQLFSVPRNSGKIIKIGYDPKSPEFSLNPLLAEGLSLKGHFGSDWVSWRHCIRLLGMEVLRIAPLITHIMGLINWEEGFALTRTKMAPSR